MDKILLIDTLGDSHQAIKDVMGVAGWEVVVVDNPAEACPGWADAVVLATDVVDLGRTLREVQAACKADGVPLVLIVDMDRSGWEQTFCSADALEVDVIFDKPLEVDALIKRLKGIQSARQEVPLDNTSPEMSTIIARAIENEKEAAAFYRRAAEKVGDGPVHDALEGLMADEQEHRKILEEFRAGTRPLPKDIAKGGSLVECFGAPKFDSDMSPADSFLLAAQKEKRAVEFYEKWADFYNDGPERELLLYLAEIERNHKAKVESMFACAAFPESW